MTGTSFIVCLSLPHFSLEVAVLLLLWKKQAREMKKR